MTPRELEVVALVAQGLSNRQIAERLAVGEQTVKNHVSRAARKLGVRNRTAVALWVLEQRRAAA